MAEIGEYRLLGKLGEGTFSEVLRVRNKKNGKTYAIKRFRKHFNSIDEIENLREIQALRRLNHHPNIIQLEEVIFDARYGILSLAFEIMDSNLYEVLSRKGHAPLHEQRAKWIMWQITKALDFVHSKGIFHRDIKPENILVRGDIHTVPVPFPNANPASPYHLTTSFPIVKLADFGSCRGIHSKMPYTEYIATRWYRSPECLLFDGVYTYKMDVWGIGCVFFELVTKVPLFPGDDEVDQLHKIHHVLGTPSDRLLKAMVASGQNAILNGVAGNGSSSSSSGANAANASGSTAGQKATGGHAATATKDGKTPAVKGIFKKKFAFPPTKGTGLKAAFPPHILHGASKVNPKHASGSSSSGYSSHEYPGLSEECVHLVELLLQYDPDARPTARHALKHPWLKECRDAEALEKQQQAATTAGGDKPLVALPMVAGSNVNKASNVDATATTAQTPSQAEQVADPLKTQIKRRTKNAEKPPATGELGAESGAKAEHANIPAGYKPVLAAGSVNKNANAAAHGATVEDTQNAMRALNVGHHAAAAATLKKNTTDASSLAEALLSPTVQAKLNGFSKQREAVGASASNKAAVAPPALTQPGSFSLGKAFVGGAAITLAPQQQSPVAAHAAHPPFCGNLVHPPSGLPAVNQAAPGPADSGKFSVDLNSSMNRGKFTNPIPLLAKDLKKQPSGSLPPSTKRIPLAATTMPVAVNGQPALSGFAITNGLASVSTGGATTSGIHKEKLPSITGSHASAATQHAITSSHSNNNVQSNSSNGSNNGGTGHVSGTTAIKGTAALPSLNGKKPLPPMNSATVHAFAAAVAASHGSDVKQTAAVEVKSALQEAPAAIVPPPHPVEQPATKSPSVPQPASVVAPETFAAVSPVAPTTPPNGTSTIAASTVPTSTIADIPNSPPTTNTTTDTTDTTAITTPPASLPATYIVESSAPQNTKLLGLKQPPSLPPQSSIPREDGMELDLPSQQPSTDSAPMESSVAQPDGPGRPTVDTSIGAGNAS